MYYVYILTNEHNHVLYTGITNNLERRVYEHRHNQDKKSFTYRYNVKKLVYFEEGDSAEGASKPARLVEGPCGAPRSVARERKTD